MEARYIKRDIEPFILKCLKMFPSIALSGARQTGKSTLLKKLLKDKYKYITFDDPIIREQAVSDPKLFLENAGEYVILDEIQHAPQIVSYVKIAIDEKRNKNGQFVLTGSQQFTLIKNLGDSLAGRVGLVNLFPFSIEEKKKKTTLKKKLANTLNAFIHACLIGSYPELIVKSNIDTNVWYSTYLQTYLERDIRGIYDIGSLRDFQLFIQLLASRCAQILNLSTFASELGISVNTIKKWISILEASQIVYILPAYYRTLGKRIARSPKIYFYDVGLICYLTGIRTKEQLLQGPMKGQCFENFCIQEIIKWFYIKGRKPNLYFLRTNNGLEIDLLIEGTELKITPVEIKMSRSPKLEFTKNIENFKKTFSKLKQNDGKLICFSEDSYKISKSVECCTLEQFLKSL